MTTKQKILIGIPLIIITGFLVYRWTVILTTNVIATWKHYIGLILFFVLVVLFYKKDKIVVIAIGIYLSLGIMNLLVITPSINLFFIEIKPLSIFFSAFVFRSFRPLFSS
jgi:hypothetical protein